MPSPLSPAPDASPPGNASSGVPDPLATTKYALTALGVALLSIQLVFCDRISSDDFRFSSLCAVVLGALLWSRRSKLAFESNVASSTIGVLLIAAYLARSAGQPGSLFITIGPVVWGVGLALLASGFRGLPQYWREAMILGAMVVTPFFQTFALDIAGVDLAPWTTQVTVGFLRLIGRDAIAQDVLIGTPSGWVVVSQGCSGLKTMYFLGGFAVLVLLMLPAPGMYRKIILLVAGPVIGFLVNALRVLLLALLAAPEHHRAFRFWHIQGGAMLVEAVAVVVFLSFYYMIVPTKGPPPRNPPRSTV